MEPGESIPNLPAIVAPLLSLRRRAFNLGLLCGVNSSTTRDKASRKFRRKASFAWAPPLHDIWSFASICFIIQTSLKREGAVELCRDNGRPSQNMTQRAREWGAGRSKHTALILSQGPARVRVISAPEPLKAATKARIKAWIHRVGVILEAIQVSTKTDLHKFLFRFVWRCGCVLWKRRGVETSLRQRTMPWESDTLFDDRVPTKTSITY